ncbi:MAG TPA: hypothetical protein VLZ83_07960 [Edaphocola sp.]|nr:hypothetical protein [Edaphocola sp.]
MNSKIYLKNRLTELYNKFANLSIKYQYDSYTEKHIVEVLPFSEYDTNEDYLNFESELSFEFDNMFFPESVMFISEESLTKITNPEFILEKQIFSIENHNIKHTFRIEKEDKYTCVEYTYVDKTNYCLAA